MSRKTNSFSSSSLDISRNVVFNLLVKKIFTLSSNRQAKRS